MEDITVISLNPVTIQKIISKTHAGGEGTFKLVKPEFCVASKPFADVA